MFGVDRKIVRLFLGNPRGSQRKRRTFDGEPVACLTFVHGGVVGSDCGGSSDSGDLATVAVSSREADEAVGCPAPAESDLAVGFHGDLPCFVGPVAPSRTRVDICRLPSILPGLFIVRHDEAPVRQQVRIGFARATICPGLARLPLALTIFGYMPCRPAWLLAKVGHGEQFHNPPYCRARMCGMTRGWRRRGGESKRWQMSEPPEWWHPAMC